MTDVPPPAGDPAEQPVVAMELLDDQPAAAIAGATVRPAPGPVPRLWTWAAVALAAAGALEIIGSVQWLVSQRITVPDGGYLEMDMGATVLRYQSTNAPNAIAASTPHLGVTLQAGGVLAVLVALGLVVASRGRLRRFARPVATLTAGLVLGSLAMLAMDILDAIAVRDPIAQVTTAVGAGTCLSAASAVAAIVAIVLILRIDDTPPEPAGPDAEANAAADAVADLDTPPLGFPLPAADLN